MNLSRYSRAVILPPQESAKSEEDRWEEIACKNPIGEGFLLVEDEENLH